VRRWARLRRDTVVTAVRPTLEVRPASAEINLVAMGASTGGPLVLQTILSGIPINFSVPVLIVQHMAAGFIKGFVEWLAPTSALPIDVATHGEQILPGHAYIAPDGFQMNIADSIIRARYRSSRERPELMEPGKVYEFTIIPYPTGNVFQKGHCIAVHISSSNWPRFDLNPNTGEPLGRHTRMVVADQVVYHDGEHPSHIVLPVIPKA